MAGLNSRAMAYTHMTAFSLWEKLRRIEAAIADPTATLAAAGTLTVEMLNATMISGAHFAQQMIYTYDDPMLTPRR